MTPCSARDARGAAGPAGRMGTLGRFGHGRLCSERAYSGVTGWPQVPALPGVAVPSLCHPTEPCSCVFLARGWEGKEQNQTPGIRQWLESCRW